MKLNSRLFVRTNRTPIREWFKARRQTSEERKIWAQTPTSITAINSYVRYVYACFSVCMCTHIHMYAVCYCDWVHLKFKFNATVAAAAPADCFVLEFLLGSRVVAQLTHTHTNGLTKCTYTRIDTIRSLWSSATPTLPSSRFLFGSSRCWHEVVALLCSLVGSLVRAPNLVPARSYVIDETNASFSLLPLLMCCWGQK